MELGEARYTRIAYHQGKIEFMTPLWEHENRNWQIGRLIILLIEELDLEYELGGSVTLKRPERAAGKELDSWLLHPKCCLSQRQHRIRLN